MLLRFYNFCLAQRIYRQSLHWKTLHLSRLFREVRHQSEYRYHPFQLQVLKKIWHIFDSGWSFPNDLVYQYPWGIPFWSTSNAHSSSCYCSLYFLQACCLHFWRLSASTPLKWLLSSSSSVVRFDSSVLL